MSVVEWRIRTAKVGPAPFVFVSTGIGSIVHQNRYILKAGNVQHLKLKIAVKVSARSAASCSVYILYDHICPDQAKFCGAAATADAHECDIGVKAAWQAIRNYRLAIGRREPKAAQDTNRKHSRKAGKYLIQNTHTSTYHNQD